MDRDIPIVADDAIDPKFGTGAVKVTPAHDPLDFEIGRRHGLESLNVLTPDAHINENAPARFQGLTREEARKQVVREFEALGLLEKVETHRHAVGHCYRCGTVVEPRLSEQWFVRMAPLAAPALQAYRDGTVRFIPERARHGVRAVDGGHPRLVHLPPALVGPPDSRLVLRRAGVRPHQRVAHRPHRLPPLRRHRSGRTRTSSTPGSRRGWCPFSSLGWPAETPDLERFYPGHTLVTAPEILFFWVARMIMAGLEFQGKVPFHTVYLHGTVRDTQHRKMSKSLGNGIDPLEVIERYGADALRYTVISGMAVGTDLILDPADLETSFAAGRNFANKLWNAGRFILGTLDGPTRPLAGPHANVVRPEELTLADRWIIARCDATVRAATEAYEKFRLNDAAAAVYHFLWSDLADWYIEQAKPRLYGSQPGGDVARAVAAQTFDVALRLLHPVMPFVTETLWKRLPGRADADSVSVAPWPVPDDRATDDEALAGFAEIQLIITSLRQLRADAGLHPGDKAIGSLTTAGAAARARIAPSLETITRLAKVTIDAVVVRSGATASAGALKTAVLPDGDRGVHRAERGGPRPGVRAAGQGGGASPAVGRGAGAEARQRAVRGPRPRRRGRGRATEARDLAGTGGRAGREPTAAGLRVNVQRLTGAAIALGIIACAKIEPPPGGPPDLLPPGLVATIPESMAVLPDFSGDVEFIFNETVSEGGSPNMGLGTGDLEKLDHPVAEREGAQRPLEAEPGHRPARRRMAPQHRLPDPAPSRRDGHPPEPERQHQGGHLHDRRADSFPAPDRSGLGLDDGAPRPPCAGRRGAPARQPPVPHDGGLGRQVRFRPAAERRLPGVRRHRPEPERPARSA